jgi:hypothetical protein
MGRLTVNTRTLTRHADVLAALREPGLYAALANPRMRECAASAYSLDNLSAWRRQIELLAARMLDDLKQRPAIDLVRDFATPWSLAVARMVTGANADDLDALAALAQIIFSAGAEPEDPVLDERAKCATAELVGHFSGESAALHVQAFVALSQSLAAFLAGAFLALLDHPAEMHLLHAQPDLIGNAIEELLRFAGPAAALVRRPSPAGKLILMIADANRDPGVFPDPHRLDLRRSAAGHLAFGAGLHACVGAPLIRMAASVAIPALVAEFSGRVTGHQVEWRPGFAIRAPASLRLSLR